MMQLNASKKFYIIYMANAGYIYLPSKNRRLPENASGGCQLIWYHHYNRNIEMKEDMG